VNGSVTRNRREFSSSRERSERLDIALSRCFLLVSQSRNWSVRTDRLQNRLLPKPALRPPMFFRRLASNFSSDCLSLCSRERSEPLDNALSRWSLFSRRKSDWPAQQTGTEDLPREAGIATWHDLCQPCVPARYLPALRPLMLLRASLPGMYFPASLPDEVGLASFRRQPCVFQLMFHMHYVHKSILV